MLPAKEVGGDYYDIIETDAGDRWVAIGDVAGHGVDSGLIMMMAQASIMTVIKGNPARSPSTSSPPPTASSRRTSAGWAPTTT